MVISTTSKKPTILETIYAQRAKDVELAKSTPGTTPTDITSLLASNVAPPLISFVDRLKRNPSSSSSSPSPSLMAEIKRASPSKGPIALSTNPAQQALAYALSGASVISILTEPTWFKGSLVDLRLARQAVDTLLDRPAILRKEFILDEYQIAEARLHGADAILLIVAMLSPERLHDLYAYSLSLDMEPLVEVNNAKEMEIALNLGARVIGVNNRNLHDFHVDMGTTSRLVEMVHGRDVVLCSLSGISNSNDVQMYKDQGVRAVLVGEALMRAEDTGAFIRELLQWPEPVPEVQQKPWVLVSGVTIVEEGISYLGEGADMLGVIFDPSNGDSEFNISIQEATDLARNIDIYRTRNPTSPPYSPPLSLAPWFTTQKRLLISSGRRHLLVGIFRNCSLADIIRTRAVVNLDLVQLDEAAPLSWAKHIPVPVIRRFRAQSRDITYPGLHSFCLVEPDVGGSGVVTEVVPREEAPNWPLPIILSGVVTGADIHQAIETLHPWALEVNLEKDEHFFQVLDIVKAL